MGSLSAGLQPSRHLASTDPKFIPSDASIPAASVHFSVSPQVMPCCINPPVIKDENQPSSGSAAPAKKIVPQHFERVVSQANNFCTLVEGREHFLQLVKG